MPAGAQVVRGVVRDVETNAPLAGVVVSLHRAGTGDAAAGGDASRVIATLTNDRGEFALSPGVGGSFHLSAKRIGALRFVSGAFALGDGETQRRDVSLEGIRYNLAPVTVTTVSPCRTAAGERQRIAALWEEARAALAASELSRRERRYRATIVRYRRLLTPGTLRVRHESREQQQAVTERPFFSISAESLATMGYARLVEGGEVEFFAPDEQVLLSESFVRDHCFTMARDRHADVEGISFEPVRNRRVSDIRGTIWLDRRSHELRFVSFAYTNFPLPVNDTLTGGEVHFRRLAAGAWLVSRWFIRVPQATTQSTPSVSARVPRAPDRVVVVGYQEDGGEVTPDDGVRAPQAQIAGQIADSTGAAPLAGATVVLEGTTRRAVSGRDGAFTLDSVPFGNYSLIVTHPTYDDLGLIAGEQVLSVERTGRSVTAIRAIDTGQILRQLCGFEPSNDSTVALRLVRRDSATNTPLPDRSLQISWQVMRGTAQRVRAEERSLDVTTDSAGGATACGAPREVRVRIDERVAGRPQPLFTWWITTPRRGWALSTLRH